MDYGQFQDRAKGFHWRDGLYFERLEDGRVQITQYTPINPADWTKGVNQAWQLRIVAEEWASIVTTMSTAGETTQTYYDFLNFHNGTL